MTTAAARVRPAARREDEGRPKVARQIARTIVREIRRRGLTPGDKLISEQKMVERYRVARGSLREALRFLELQGVLRIKSGPGGGPVVGTPSTQHLASTLALLLQFVGAPFRAIIETRWAIEPGIAALAAERATKEDLATLGECLRDMETQLGDGDRFREENRRFHDLVAFAAGNPVFAFLLPALHKISEGSGIAYNEEERQRILVATGQIHTAIARRDPGEASATMRRFFDASLVYLDRTYPEIMSRPLAWEDLDL